jgi:DNA invertase Pin-like site-specific DNA recombinase
MSAPVKAVAYFRMSTDKQEESIPRQRDSVHSFARVNGYEIVREYLDAGVSGDATEKRAGFLEMREDAARGDFEVILCWDKDRFGRFDSIEQGYWVKPLRDAGVRLVTVAQGLVDWNSFGGRIVDAALAESKHEFLRSHSQNTTAGLIRNAKGAYFNGGQVPYAFDRMLLNERDEPQRRLPRGMKTDKPPGWHTVLVPVETTEEIEVVRWLFRSFDERDVSCRALANELNARGIPGPGSLEKGRPTLWSREVVKAMLRNAHYAGDHVWGQTNLGKYFRVVGGEPRVAAGVPRTKTGTPRKATNTEGLVIHRDAHAAIVDRDVWDRVQAKMEGRRREQRFPRGKGYVLAGLVKCGHCGKRMHGSTGQYKKRSGRKSYRRYVCASYDANGSGVCGYHAILEEKLLPYLIRILQREYLAPQRLEQLKAELLRQASAKHEASPERVEKLRAKRDQLNADIRQGARNLVRAGPHIDLLNEALSELRGELAGVERELAAAERAQRTPVEDVEQVIEAAVAALYNLRERLDEAEPTLLREVLRQMVSSIELYFEPIPKQKRVHHRLIRGVLKLRPQVDVSGIKECQAWGATPTWTTAATYRTSSARALPAPSIRRRPPATSRP